MNDTITHRFLEASQSRKTLTALKFKENRKWNSLNWSEFYALSEQLGAALLSFGLKKGDRIGILSNTRYEWAISDMGILGIGSVTVPIYTNNHPSDIEFILNNSDCKILICESHEQALKCQSLIKNCPSVEKIISMDQKKDQNGDSFSWTAFLEIGKNFLSENPDCFEKNSQENTLEDMATIIYTSGTTGKPKGVVLTHKQIMSEVIDVFEMLNINEKDSTLSFLPYAHIFGRVELWGSIFGGYTLAFAESIEKISKNLLDIRPTFMIGVPRIFEKIYGAILNQVEAHPLKKKIFDWSLRVGKEVSHKRLKKEPLSIKSLSQYVAVKKIFFEKIQEKMGGRLKFAVSGGAPLSPEIAEFFHAAGLLILEGYGLTETTAGICLNTPLEYKFGTVGKPVGDVEIKIADDGEILVKSDKVMKEYYKNPQATDSVFIDGFFATGDIGEFDSDGFLKITDRKKDLIKTAGGKYIAPQRLENLLKLSPYISNVLIHGDKRKYVVALITLDKPSVEAFAEKNNVTYRNFDSLAKSEKVQSLIREAVAQTNDSLASFETIKNFSILSEDFTVESGELTPSLKVKRKVCDSKYKDVLDSLY